MSGLSALSLTEYEWDVFRQMYPDVRKKRTAPKRKFELGNYENKHVCLFCWAPTADIVRHIERKHDSEKQPNPLLEMAHAFRSSFYGRSCFIRMKAEMMEVLTNLPLQKAQETITVMESIGTVFLPLSEPYSDFSVPPEKWIIEQREIDEFNQKRNKCEITPDATAPPTSNSVIEKKSVATETEYEDDGSSTLIADQVTREMEKIQRDLEETISQINSQIEETTFVREDLLREKRRYEKMSASAERKIEHYKSLIRHLEEMPKTQMRSIGTEMDHQEDEVVKKADNLLNVLEMIQNGMMSAVSEFKAEHEEISNIRHQISKDHESQEHSIMRSVGTEMDHQMIQNGMMSAVSEFKFDHKEISTIRHQISKDQYLSQEYSTMTQEERRRARKRSRRRQNKQNKRNRMMTENSSASGEILNQSTLYKENKENEDIICLSSPVKTSSRMNQQPAMKFVAILPEVEDPGYYKMSSLMQSSRQN